MLNYMALPGDLTSGADVAQSNSPLGSRITLHQATLMLR